MPDLPNTTFLFFTNVLQDFRICISARLRLATTLENNSFKTLAVSLSFLAILSPSAIVILSLKIILLDNDDLTTFQSFFTAANVCLV